MVAGDGGPVDLAEVVDLLGPGVDVASARGAVDALRARALLWGPTGEDETLAVVPAARDVVPRSSARFGRSSPQLADVDVPALLATVPEPGRRLLQALATGSPVGRTRDAATGTPPDRPVQQLLRAGLLLRVDEATGGTARPGGRRPARRTGHAGAAAEPDAPRTARDPGAALGGGCRRGWRSPGAAASRRVRARGARRGARPGAAGRRPRHPRAPARRQGGRAHRGASRVPGRGAARRGPRRHRRAGGLGGLGVDADDGGGHLVGGRSRGPVDRARQELARDGATGRSARVAGQQGQADRGALRGAAPQPGPTGTQAGARRARRPPCRVRPRRRAGRRGAGLARTPVGWARPGAAGGLGARGGGGVRPARPRSTEHTRPRAAGRTREPGAVRSRGGARRGRHRRDGRRAACPRRPRPGAGRPHRRRARSAAAGARSRDRAGGRRGSPRAPRPSTGWARDPCAERSTPAGALPSSTRCSSGPPAPRCRRR